MRLMFFLHISLFIVPGEAAQEFERERDLVADIMVGNGEEMHVGR